MGAHLRRHHVAGLAAELHRLHVLDGPVRGLGPDDDVDQRDGAEEPGHPPDRGLPVHDLHCEPLPGALAGEQDPHGNHPEAGHQDDRDDQEDEIPMYGLSTCPRTCSGNTNNQEIRAVPTSPIPRRLSQWLVINTKNGRSRVGSANAGGMGFSSPNSG